MEKISGIVPKSRRVSAVDIATGPAVRPGAPAYGRPMGESPITIKESRTTAQKAVSEFKHQNDLRKTSASPPEIVEQMANSFFLKKTIEAPAEPIQTKMTKEDPNLISEDGEESEDIGQVAKTAVEGSDAVKEYVPPGTYLNLSA